MNFSLRENRTLRFIVIFLALFLVWTIIYQWILNPWGKLDKLIINDCSLWALFILEKLNYPTFIGHNPVIRTIGIDGTQGLWIGDPCNGLTLFAMFIFFILAYPGNWKHKLWYIPMGITLIHFFNIWRIVFLCIIVYKHPSWMEFNHSYLFQVIMYLLIFALWYIWIRKFSPRIEQPAKG